MQHCQPRTAIQMPLVSQLQMERHRILAAVSSILFSESVQKIPPLTFTKGSMRKTQPIPQFCLRCCYWPLGDDRSRWSASWRSCDVVLPLLLLRSKSSNVFQLRGKPLEDC